MSSTVGTYLLPTVIQADRHDAVEARRAPERRAARPRPTDPDRDTRPLHRPRRELDAVEVEVVAVEGERLTGHQAGHDLEPLIQDRRSRRRVARFAEDLELLVRRVAQSRPEDRPSVRQVIERHDLPHHLPGPAPGEGRQHRAEPDPVGRERDGGQDRPRIGHHVAVPDEQVVPHEIAVPAGLLGVVGHRRVEPRVGQLAEVREADGEPHGAESRIGGCPTNRRSSALATVPPGGAGSRVITTSLPASGS